MSLTPLIFIETPDVVVSIDKLSIDDDTYVELSQADTSWNVVTVAKDEDYDADDENETIKVL